MMVLTYGVLAGSGAFFSRLVGAAYLKTGGSRLRNTRNTHRLWRAVPRLRRTGEVQGCRALYVRTYWGGRVRHLQLE
ncbi:hypothetical protein GGS23DRAFT_133144 [Durotheca rogersii]|uniref:uncharacterized protein n=1 Tax=Durotheca rogersii TaxID=419775 RepID=UPI00221FB294|nr:uncharacterized protein GGS23DRAFT_133144 [Durotheca rogersii]KAI5861819.1 hypothetical protein GGS23DRAFT_133144 [Durotheca rogersii]